MKLFTIYDYRHRMFAERMDFDSLFFDNKDHDNFPIPVLGISNYISSISPFCNFLNSHRGWFLRLHRRKLKSSEVVAAYVSGELIGYIPPIFYSAIDPFFRGKGTTIARILNAIPNDTCSDATIILQLSATDIYEHDYNATHELPIYIPKPILDDTLPTFHRYIKETHRYLFPINPIEHLFYSNPKDPNSSRFTKHLSTRSPFIDQASLLFQEETFIAQVNASLSIR